ERRWSDISTEKAADLDRLLCVLPLGEQNENLLRVHVFFSLRLVSTCVLPSARDPETLNEVINRLQRLRVSLLSKQSGNEDQDTGIVVIVISQWHAAKQPPINQLFGPSSLMMLRMRLRRGVDVPQNVPRTCANSRAAYL